MISFSRLNEIHVSMRSLVNTPETQDIDPMTGAPVSVPPVMPDPLVDDVAKIAIVIREWLNTEAGLKLQQTDQPGFQRIRMYLQACVQILQQAQMAAAAAAAPGEEGAAPGGGGEPAPPPPQPEAAPEAQPQAA